MELTKLFSDGNGEYKNVEFIMQNDTQEGTLGGIPVTHIALFGGGLIVAIGALVGINIYQKRTGKSAGSEEDDDEI